MAWDDFGKSWLSIIANPAGYLLGRKSNSDAANDYRNGNPIEGYLNGLESEYTYENKRVKWTNDCASKLKDDDKGKSKSNALNACESAWNNDPYSIEVLTAIQGEQDAAAAKRESQAGLRTNILFVLLVALFIVAIFVLYKKYKK